MCSCPAWSPRRWRQIAGLPPAKQRYSGSTQHPLLPPVCVFSSTSQVPLCALTQLAPKPLSNISPPLYSSIQHVLDSWRDFCLDLAQTHISSTNQALSVIINSGSFDYYSRSSRSTENASHRLVLNKTDCLAVSGSRCASPILMAGRASSTVKSCHLEEWEQMRRGRGAGKGERFVWHVFIKPHQMTPPPPPQVQTFACPRTHSDRLSVICIPRASGDILISGQVSTCWFVALVFKLRKCWKGRKRLSSTNERSHLQKRIINCFFAPFHGSACRWMPPERMIIIRRVLIHVIIKLTRNSSFIARYPRSPVPAMWHERNECKSNYLSLIM